MYHDMAINRYIVASLESTLAYLHTLQLFVGPLNLFSILCLMFLPILRSTDFLQLSLPSSD